MSAGRRCRLGQKRRFRDHKEAVRALHKAASSRQQASDTGVDCRRREVRTYECAACGGWHLTSQEARA